ncbi:MAG: glycosyltransferase [Selenomonadaceae bacterium]|nr:glycosyltransferase [Selenomonadaceae bacterium]
MGLPMKIYRALTGATVRNFVKRVEKFCAKNLPTVHKKIFLPTKAAAKSALLKVSMRKKSARPEKFWTPATRENFSPLVSIVVPNFNHAPYLRERLETIYKQTYKNFEVILLDDASTDDSLKILREFQSLHADNTRLVVNEKNSGGVFKQWQRGIELATGELIWIAESDDFSSENFLSELVPAFADDAIELAFCRTDFIQDGQKIFTTEDYLLDVPAFDWRKNFAVTAAEFVAQGFAVKNIIPNVSGVVFRRPKNFHAEILELWDELKLCGDWAFYLDTIKGGCIYYTPSTTNFYRVHQKSTSLKVQDESRYFSEHERIAEFVAKNYCVPAEVHENHFKQLEEHARTHDMKNTFDREKILSVARKPNILIGVFAMSIGGGETFPLILANELSRKNFPVTVVDFQMADELSDVRKKLNSDVPLIRLNETNSLADVVEQFKIDVIHTHHGAVDSAVSYVVEQNPKLRHVVTLHGMYEAADESYLRKILERVKKSVAVFAYIADKNLVPLQDILSLVPCPFSLKKIGNGLAKCPINPVSRADLNIPEKSFVACVVSRAIPQKGWLAAIDAVKLANERGGRRIDLILVGAGEVYDELIGNVPDFVHLTGFKSNVRDYLAAADVGLLPSEYAGESFPLLIIDSFFAGRPVVSSNLGEVPNMIDGAGIVFDLVDGKVPVDTLAKILRELADDRTAYEKISSRVDVAAEKFSIEHVAEEYIKLYEGKIS